MGNYSWKHNYCKYEGIDFRRRKRNGGEYRKKGGVTVRRGEKKK